MNLSRQSLSPMECSTNVLESSGIEIIGEALPDLSPIKSIINQGGKLVTEVEDPNNSVDDGGPLEVSALSVKDENDKDNSEKKEREHVDDDDDKDDEMPPKITMEDLADDLDSTEENVNDQSTDSPQLKFAELTPRVKSDPEKSGTEDMDVESNEREGMTYEETNKQVKNLGQDPKYIDHRDEHSRVTKDNPVNGYPASSTYRNSQARDYSTTEHFHRSIHLNELDEDVIITRAKVALRRANRLSPTKDASSFSFDPHSLTLSDLSLNGSTAWDPVRMSTPLVTQSGASSRYRSYARGNDSCHGYKSIGRSRWYDGTGVTYSDESGLGRSGGEMPLYNFHGFSGRRLSPAVEDIIRRRKLHGEGRYPLSNPWKKPSSPLFTTQNDRKLHLSQTHPMSYVEWKALYWRPPRDDAMWRNNYQYHTSQHGYDSDFKRSSWPPRPVSSKLIYGSRPLSPPVTFPPAKVPRAVPGGYVSKIALPSYQDSSDSGYSDWSRSTSRRDNAVRSQHSSVGYAGEFRYYY